MPLGSLDPVNTLVIHTLNYSLPQLERLHDLIDSGTPVRIVHLLLDDDRSHWEDRYIVILDCDDRVHLLLCLI